MMRTAIGFLLLSAAFPLSAQTLTNAVRHDTSPPISSILVEVPDEPFEARRTEHRVRPIPFPTAAPGARRAATEAPAAPIQAPLDLAPMRAPFLGIGPEIGYKVKHAPPDTTGAPGTTQYVQWVNEAFAVFDKATGKPVVDSATGRPVLKPGGVRDGRVIWSGFGGVCEDTNDGDPIVLFDRMRNRWVLSQFAVHGGGRTFSQCVAISLTDDATGRYHRYEFQYNDFNDYPKFGVWPDAYYVTYNMFRGRAFLGAKACALERAAMLNGDPARMICFDLNGFGGVLPSDADSTPPAAMPNHLVNFGVDTLNVWKFHVDWSTPASSTLTKLGPIDVTRFDPPCPLGADGLPSACIPQGPSTQPDQKLDALGDRLMYRLAYRRVEGRDALVVNHTVKTGTGTGMRVYDLTINNAGVSVARQQTYAPDGRFRWMGSVAMDKRGDLLIGYTASGVDLFPSIRFAGNAAGETAIHDEHTMVAGAAAQVSATDPLERWGDYSTLTIDPTDDCTFWYTAQVETAEGTFNWSTRIGSVKFASCR